MLEEIMKSEDFLSKVERFYRGVFGLINNLFGGFYELGIKCKALKVMKKILARKIEIFSEDRKMVRTLAEHEILFYDQVKTM